MVFSTISVLRGCPFYSCGLVLYGIQVFHITHHHQRDLEGQRIVKIAKIKSCTLLNLLNAIDQRVAVYKQLPGCFRHIQVVFKKLVNCSQSLLIQVSLIFPAAPRPP